MRGLLMLAVVAAVVALAVWAVTSIRRPAALPPAPRRPQVADDRPTPDWSPPPDPREGWYGDPLGAHRLRYWDGRAWTEQTAD